MSSLKHEKNGLDYRQIFDSTMEAIFIHDADSGTVIDVNQTMVDMFGFHDKKEFLNGDQSVLSSGDPDYSAEKAFAYLHEAKKIGVVVFEWHARRKNGTLFWVEVSLRYVRKTNIIIAMVRDISYRKQLEQQKKINEDNLRLLITHSRDPIFIKDTDGRYQVVSNAMAKILGQSIPDIVGKTHEELFSDGRSERVNEIDRRVLAGETVQYSDTLFHHNKENHIQVTKLPIKGAGGQITGLLGIVSDVSEQIKTFNQLKDTHARLETIIREAPVGIALSRDGFYLDANPAYLKMFQIPSADDIRGTSILNHIAPGEREKVKRIIEKRKKSDKVPTEYETIGVKVDGQEFPFYVNVKRIELEDGPLTIAFFMDLSEKKAAEQNLLFLETAIEQSHEGIAIADLNGNIIYANPRWAQMHEWEVADIIGKNLSIFHTREQLEKEVIPFNELVMKKGSHEGEVGHVTASGQTFPTYMVTTLIKNKAGQSFAILGTTHDLSEQKEFQARLSVSEKKLARAQELGKTGYMEWDLKQNKVYISEQIAQMAEIEEKYGWITVDEMMSMLHPEDIPAIQNKIEAVINGKISQYNVEHRVKKPDGTYIWVHSQAELVKDSMGHPDYLLGFAQDITERKKAEEKEAHLRAELFQAQKMESIGRLAGGVAHDFNNMLSVILGYGEMLMREIGPDHPFYKKISSIYDAGNRAQNLTRQLLAFSRKQALEIKVVSLSDIINGFMNLMKSLLPEDIQLRTEFPSEQLMIEADAAQIEQVLLNLAVNAKDAMPNGGTISIMLDKVNLTPDQTDIKPGDYARIKVKDSGEGMSEDVLKNIFEPFYTTKKQGKGTGLGLSTCFGIVAQHEGRISVSSERNVGTEFTILLPLAENISTPVGELQTEVNDALSGTETVLLVEDEPFVRELARSILVQNGYTVIETSGPKEAIQEAKKNAQIDIVLTDIVMPDMKGPDMFQMIRRTNPTIKVIYMSGYSEDVVGKPGISIEDENFIQKPFTLNSLLSAVYRTLHPEEFGH